MAKGSNVMSHDTGWRFALQNTQMEWHKEGTMLSVNLYKYVSGGKLADRCRPYRSILLPVHCLSFGGTKLSG